MDVTISVPEGHEQIQMLGSAQRHLKLIREALGVSVHSRNGTIRVSGEPGAVVVARGVLERLAERARAGASTTRQEVLDLIAEGPSRARSGSLGGGAGAWAVRHGIAWHRVAWRALRCQSVSQSVKSV